MNIFREGEKGGYPEDHLKSNMAELSNLNPKS